MAHTFFVGACFWLTATGGCTRFNVLPPTIVDASGRPASQAADTSHTQPVWEPMVSEGSDFQSRRAGTVQEAVSQSASPQPAGNVWEQRSAYNNAASGQAPGAPQWQPLYTGDPVGSAAYGSQAAPSMQQTAAVPEWSVRENSSGVQSQRMTAQPDAPQGAVGPYSQQNRPRVTQVLENPNALRSPSPMARTGGAYDGYADLSATGNFAVANPAEQQRPTVASPQVSNVWVTEPNPPSSMMMPQGSAETAVNPQMSYSSVGPQSTALPESEPTQPALKQIEPAPMYADGGPVPAVNEQTRAWNVAGRNEPSANAAMQSAPFGQQEALPSPMANRAVGPAPLPRDPLLAAMERLEQMVRQHPEDRVSQLTLRLFYLNHGMEEKALSLLPDLPSDLQSETIAMARAITMTQKAQDAQNRNNPLYANEALEALEHWETEIARKADFSVANFVLCETGSVKGFGQYEPLGSQALAGGQAQTIQIYCELKNFSSQQQADGSFLSKVAVEISLVDRSYREIMSLPRGEIPDTSRNQRHDFFFSGPVGLPSLPPGEYELVVKVEDVLANKTSLPARHRFTVKGQN